MVTLKHAGTPGQNYVLVIRYPPHTPVLLWGSD